MKIKAGISAHNGILFSTAAKKAGAEKTGNEATMGGMAKTGWTRSYKFPDTSVKLHRSRSRPTVLTGYYERKVLTR